MSNKHENLTSLFVDIADAIREKTGGTATVVADDFPDAIRAIEAGGGGDAEWCDVTLKVGMPLGPGEGLTIYYVDPKMTLQNFTCISTDGDVLAIAKNTIVYLTTWTSVSEVSGSVSLIECNESGTAAYFVNGNCTFTLRI